MQNEVDELEQFIEEAESEKGVNWSNAGRLLVFPIGIWATYENAGQAIDAANQREVSSQSAAGNAVLNRWLSLADADVRL